LIDFLLATPKAFKNAFSTLIEGAAQNAPQAKDDLNNAD